VKSLGERCKNHALREAPALRIPVATGRENSGNVDIHNRLQNEKATRQQGDLFFSRENSSNGGLDSVKTFCTKSYEPKKGGVKQFLGNKCLSFQ
jgi:hypothetical protein